MQLLTTPGTLFTFWRGTGYESITVAETFEIGVCQRFVCMCKCVHGRVCSPRKIVIRHSETASEATLAQSDTTVIKGAHIVQVYSGLRNHGTISVPTCYETRKWYYGLRSGSRKWTKYRLCSELLDRLLYSPSFLIKVTHCIVASLLLFLCF